jgi:hypothetical protein
VHTNKRLSTSERSHPLRKIRPPLSFQRKLESTGGSRLVVRDDRQGRTSEEGPTPSAEADGVGRRDTAIDVSRGNIDMIVPQDWWRRVERDRRRCRVNHVRRDRQDCEGARSLSSYDTFSFAPSSKNPPFCRPRVGGDPDFPKKAGAALPLHPSGTIDRTFHRNILTFVPQDWWRTRTDS